MFDLVVTDSAGAVIWQRLEGETLMQILRLDTLEPGATLALSHEWDQPEPLRTPPASLRISPP